MLLTPTTWAAALTVLTACTAFAAAATQHQRPNTRYNILFMPCHIGNSHKKSVIPLGDHLARFGGHNVTVFSTFYSNPKFPSEHVTTVDLEIWTEDQAVMDENVHGNSSGGGISAWWVTETRSIDVQYLFEMSNDICRRTMDQHPDIFQRILDTPWDVIIVDTELAPCGHVVSTLTTAASKHPTARLLLSTLTPFPYTQRHIGAPATIGDNYSWQPGYNYRQFWDRLKMAFWFQLFDYYFSVYVSHRMQVTLFESKFLGSKSPLRTYFQALPQANNKSSSSFSMWEFDQNSSFTFYQYPDEFGVYRPRLQTEIAIGGLDCAGRNELEPLLSVYEQFVSDHKSKGTILLALGHYVNWDDIPSNIPLAFYSAFQQFPNYRFIWQYVGNIASAKDRLSLVNSTNILIVDWLPQHQLLQHKKTRLLISQLGIKSALEVVCTSTPILGLPTWGDQPLTARLLANHHRAGKLLDRDLLSSEYIVEAIRDTIANEKQERQNLDKLRGQILDKPINSNDLARFWIEYSVRNHASINILTARSRFLGFPAYYCWMS